MEVLDSGLGGVGSHMEKDRELLRSLTPDSSPLLHLYEWDKPCATYGYFRQPGALFRSRVSLPVAKRPTGGGTLFHWFDFAFSLFIPSSHPQFSVNTLENYAFVSDFTARVLQPFLRVGLSLTLNEATAQSSEEFAPHCLAHLMPFDLLISGKKVGGGAQRRTRGGFLHQGSITLTLPPKEWIAEVLVEGEAVSQEIYQVSYPLIGESATAKELAEAKKELKALFTNVGRERWLL